MCNARLTKCCGLIGLLSLLFSVGLVSAENLIDPTQPPGMATASPQGHGASAPRWVLSSTLISGPRRVANINGKSVSIGEQINGATVARIEAAYVELTVDKSGKVINLSLLPKDFKRIASGAGHDSP